MTKMAAMPIYRYGENPSKIFFTGPVGRLSHLKLGLKHRGLLPIIVCSNNAWSDLDLFYGKVKFGNLGFSIKNGKTMDISETIAASGLKICRCRQLIQQMKVSEY